MIRKDAMKIVLDQIHSEPIISANGFMSRDLFELKEKNSNFYMIGSMGLASSIALGVALKNPRKKIYVFDGDGNILMNLGSLVTIGQLRPKNIIHIIFDNNSEAHDFTNFMLSNGIIVRNLKGFGLEYCVRVSVGTDTDNIFFCEVLNKLNKGH